MTQTSGSDMQKLWSSSQLNGGSAAWLESLYELYLTNPDNVELEWRNFFDALPRVKSGNGNGGLLQEIPHNEVRDYFRALARKVIMHPSHPIQKQTSNWNANRSMCCS